MKLVKSKALIDGTGGKPIEKGCVLIDGEKIKAVGLESQMKVPPGTETVDLSAEYVLPGLIDCHTHLGMRFDEPRGVTYPHEDLYRMLTSSKHMREMLRSGVTTIRNVSEKSFRAVVCRNAVESGLIPGPRMKIGTRGIRATHGWGMNAFGVDGVDNLLTFIRENLEQGADLIKIYVTGEVFRNTAMKHYYTDKEVQTIIDEVHKAGKMVAAHAHGGPGLRQALEAGVDTVEHGNMISEQDIEIMVKKGTWLIPTFNAYLHDDVLGTPGRPGEFVQGVEKARVNIDRNFPKALVNAVKFGVGTDARHGNYVFELENMVRLGVSANNAILAATKNGSVVCGMADQVGTLEPGKFADMISVPKNPLDNVSNLRDIHMVMKGGQRLDPIQL